MRQVRLYITARKAEAEKIYSFAENVFEDDGYPIAITEIDEANEIFEISIYVDEYLSSKTSERLTHLAHIDPGLLNTEFLPNINWVQHSLEGLKPVRVGRFFVHGAHDRSKIKANDLGIEIEASQAFGSGHHGTTIGCLEMINLVMRREHPRNALDMGTGSGILAIAMTKLQPLRALATDIDPIAIHVARDNIRLNGVFQSAHAVTAAGFYHPKIINRVPFDLIVANILAQPLIKMASAMARRLTYNGSLILSGILDSQRNKVLVAYRTQGLYHCQSIHRDGWVTIHLKKQRSILDVPVI
ncbi:MAG: ribosomal protein L11 methyltransferase [Candidatus Tokpelaia sp. JSC189]|nr:MAG: ribosomal protein L11 methyltransferase [Candidatus Tokpelaia sp. JSC189]